MNPTEACIALNMVPNLGPVRLRALLEAFETPERVLGTRSSHLQATHGIGPELAETLAHWEDHVDLGAELARIKERQIEVVTQSSPMYPRDLREIYNPPILLYVWGSLSDRDNRAIGVVGSRKSSHYGMDCAKKLAYQLAYAGLTVISGLARGIDTAAHQGALAAKGRTIAVLGSGLMDLYPAENIALAEKIAASGAVVSEYPMTFPPTAQNFPYRNRIVAGWGSGLLVVEAGLKSGALITANQAIENNRMVYAVPGPIDRATSAGTNRLIQQGAKLVSCAADMLDDLNTLFPQYTAAPPAASFPSAAPERPLPALSAPEMAILEAMAGEETDLDSLVTATGLSVQQISSVLLALEMKRHVRPLPGQRYAPIQK